MIAHSNSRLGVFKTFVGFVNFRKMSTPTLIEKAKLNPIDFSKANAKKDEIDFHLFTQGDAEGEILDENAIKTCNFNRKLPTKFFIHGWNSSIKKGNWYDGYKEAYFRRGSYNIVYVDWYIPGSREFPISAANVKPVGHFIGDFILASNLPLENVHIIGKSLGSHVAGFAGKRICDLTSKRVGRITGLDPAGPKFEHPNVDETNRLSASDAEFVDIIHTDAGYYGFTKAIGKVDFYPNGGASQPGCANDDNGHNDSHGRSNWYFLESINSKNFIAKKAESWEKFLEGKCEEEEIIFGEDAPTEANGLYYFETNSTFPYAKL